MSSFFEVRDAAIGKNNGVDREPILEECCRLVSEAMQGRFDTDKRKRLGPFYSVTAFYEAGQLKVVLGAGDQHDKFWTTVSCLETLFQELNANLQSGTGNWAKPK